MISDETHVTGFTELAVFGERCSGTNYAEALITQNIPSLSTTKEYGWKHGFINPRYIKESCFFVVVARDAVDWLRSFYRTPHHVGPWASGLSFAEFLRHEWSGVASGRVLGKPNRKLGLDRQTELMGDRHPITGARIENVVALRNLKLQSLRKLENLTPHVAFMRYEDLRDAPIEMIGMLRGRMGLPGAAAVKLVSQDVSRQLRRRQDDDAERDPGPLPDLSPEDLRFVIDHLDLPQEAAFGYQYSPPA